MLKNVFLSLALCLAARAEAQVVVASPPANLAGMKKVTIKNCTTTTGVRVREDMYIRSKDNKPTRMIVTVSVDGHKFYQLEEDFVATPPTEVLYLKKEMCGIAMTIQRKTSKKRWRRHSQKSSKHQHKKTVTRSPANNPKRSSSLYRTNPAQRGV